MAYRRNAPPIQNLSETISNYSLFISLYSIFLSMALVTLLVNFINVQDDTRKETDAIISMARLLNGLDEAAPLSRNSSRPPDGREPTGPGKPPEPAQSSLRPAAPP